MIQNSFKFIPGIGDKTEKMLWTTGVFTWDDLNKATNKLRIGEDKRTKIEEYVEKARTARSLCVWEKALGPSRYEASNKTPNCTVN